MKTPQRKGRDYEKKRAAKGMDLTRGSGSVWYDKEDGREGNFLCQLKRTERDSFSVKRPDFEQLQSNANAQGLDAAFLIKFAAGLEVVVLDIGYYEQLVKESYRRG